MYATHLQSVTPSNETVIVSADGDNLCKVRDIASVSVVLDALHFALFSQNSVARERFNFARSSHSR